MVSGHENGDNGADPETSTEDGCTCSSSCDATMVFHLAKYDWCYTGTTMSIDSCDMLGLEVLSVPETLFFGN